MANSKIDITLSSEASAGQVFTFKRYLLSDVLVFTWVTENFINSSRVANYYITAPTTIGVPAGSLTATLLQTYINIDYNGYGLYSIVKSANFLSIESTSDLYGFSDFSAPFASAVITNNANIPIIPPISSNVVLSTALNPVNICKRYNIAITTNNLATKIKLDGLQIETSNTSNPYIIDIVRGIDHLFEFEDTNGSVTTYQTGIIGYIDSLLTEITIIPYISGATVIVDVPTATNLLLEYSINNVNWKSSNIFSGQSIGNYTMYIRDQFGCVKTISYEVTEIGSIKPFLAISKANSINYSLQEVWDNCSIYKTDENTLSCQSLVEFNYLTKLLFQTCDKTKTQFKSNYETITADLRDVNSNLTSLTINKKSSNLNRFKSMDATYYKYETGKLGIYFDLGNLYDKFGTVIGQFTLGGNLPEFALLGQEVSIQGLGVFIIKDILYNEDKNVKSIIVDYTYEGLDTDCIVSSIYSVLPYEIYEFEIDWSLYSEGVYDVVLTNSSPTYATVVHISEKISLAVAHNDTLGIRYFNKNNRDIFYKYGITHFVRIPFVSIIAKQKDDNEVNITDTSATVIESKVFELNEFKFDVVTNEIMRKLVVALSCEYLFINNIGYVKDGNVETSNIENTNLYEISVSLIKTGFSYDTIGGEIVGTSATGYDNLLQGRPAIDSDYIEFNIPQIITDGTNFIKT